MTDPSSASSSLPVTPVLVHSKLASTGWWARSSPTVVVAPLEMKPRAPSSALVTTWPVGPPTLWHGSWLAARSQPVSVSVVVSASLLVYSPCADPAAHTIFALVVVSRVTAPSCPLSLCAAPGPGRKSYPPFPWAKPTQRG